MAQQSKEFHKHLSKLGGKGITLCIIRHGETDWNIAQRIQGQLDPGPELNANGKAQAQQAFSVDTHAERAFEATPTVASKALSTIERLRDFGADYVVVSDLMRTKQTAAILTNNDEDKITYSSEWRERSLGVLEGYTLQQAAAKFPEDYKLFASGSDYAKPAKGESHHDFHTRVQTALLNLISSFPAASRVAVVTHGGVLYEISSFVLNRSKQMGRAVSNCSVSILHAGMDINHKNKLVLVCEDWADTKHLKEGGGVQQGNADMGRG